MDLTLTRDTFTPDGVFGVLTSGNMLLAYTLEHAYASSQNPGFYSTKLPAGSYLCVKGQHRLVGSEAPFETFEVSGVPGHSGILFHPGNTEKDSSGCILLGSSRTPDSILESRIAFNRFMNLQGGDSFTLTVVDDEAL